MRLKEEKKQQEVRRDNFETERMQARFQQQCIEQDRQAAYKRALAMNIAEENKRLAESRRQTQQTSEVKERLRQDEAIRKNKYAIQSGLVR